MGTGTGSGNGPGTGGGADSIAPATTTELFLPPLPPPRSVAGTELTATWEVDEKGSSRLVSFTPTRDAGYNKRLKEVLESTRFRPAVRRDGTPVRTIATIRYTY